ncbi:MAG: glycosyltransferase family 4 protein [candidate division Zixibacteria bacterium]|nr:glycosyltransferase family 4 protein [candidate division Zixibacteria bacterium]
MRCYINKRIVIFGWADSVHVQRWARGLTKRGYEIKIISLGGKPLSDIESVIIPRKQKLSYFTQAATAVKEANRFKPDLLHAHYASGFGLWSYFTNIKPTVLSVWGADIIDFPSNPLSKYFIQKILQKADHVTATSNLLKVFALKYLSQTPEKISVIPFGVEIPENIIPQPDTGFKICYIKGHRKKYGPDILLRAIYKIKDKVPDVKLTIAGEGEMTASLKQMVKDLNLESSVYFAGFVANDQIYSLLKKHHLMVMPSVMESESFGVAVLESYACGRPVIASKIGGVPEIVVNNETGILVSPENVNELADTIIKLATDRNLCANMGINGYNFVKDNFDWEQSLDKMSELYERLIYERQ